MASNNLAVSPKASLSLIVPTIDELVASDHPYRPMLRVLDFGKLTRPLRELYSNLGGGDYPIESRLGGICYWSILRI